MRGSVPSLGALSSFVQQSPSRIPHLKLHMLARRSTSKPVSSERNLPLQRKCFHAGIPAHNLSGIFFRANENTGPSQTSSVPATVTQGEGEAPEVAAPTTLEDILQEAHPERVLYTLLSTSEGQNFVIQASAESFAAALCSIDPLYLIEPFKDVYRYLKPSLVTQPRYRWVRAIEERLDTLAEQLSEIIRRRRNASHQLTRDVCGHLLHCARVLGHGQMARQIWQIIIPEDGLKDDLDVHAYNCYMEALCWSNAFSKAEQWRLRVIPKILGIRRGDNPPPDLGGHRVGRLGLRHETLVIFRSMAGKSLEGDEETFTNLMIAMGREGDLAGAKSILKSVYNIDVDLLLQVDEEEVETPTFYELDSPLRPTNRLLHTIAHVFGSNNDIGLALKLVDFVSRQYDLRISFSLWMHLLNWAFVLSISRSGAKQREGLATGTVPNSILDTLWNEMTDEPHNIAPDVVMYTYMARSMRDRNQLLKAVEKIQQAKKLFEDHRGAAARLREELLALSDQILTHPTRDPRQVVPAEWFDLRRRFVLTSIIEDRDLQLLILTIRLTLTKEKWPGYGWVEGWERRRRPNLIAEFAEYLPNTMLYGTKGGRIEIAGLKSDRISAAASGMAMSRRNGLLRGQMDTEIATIEDLFVARQRFKAEMDEIERRNKMYNRTTWRSLAEIN